MAARQRQQLAAGLALALALVASGCVQDDGRRFNPLRSITEVSVEQERELGAQIDAEIQRRVRVIDDPVVLGFVGDLGQSLVAQIEPQPFLYRFRVIVDPSLNAFALPGGYIYLHSGTVREAGSVNELAGVLAHEIGHVRGRHIARLQEQTALPNLLTQLAGAAATWATGEGGFLVAAQGVNVALQLRYTRELEEEADELGISLLQQDGRDALGMASFFERILAQRVPGSDQLPAYLYSHPDVKDRIARVRQRARRERGAETLATVARQEEALSEVQARLALLVRSERSHWQPTLAPFERARSDPPLARAEAQLAAGDRAGALATLAEAEALEPNDPRLPFRRGELLAAAERSREATAAFARALALDPSVALVHLRLGEMHQRLGDRHSAAFHFEQAARRAAPGGDLRRRAERAVEALTFPPVRDAGLADGALKAPDADTRFGRSRERFGPGAREVVWWAQIAERWLADRERIRVRFIDPSGETVADVVAVGRKRNLIEARLADPPARVGIWRVEARLDGRVVDRRTFHQTP